MGDQAILAPGDDTMTMPRRSYYSSYRSTFYIFPALIPLAEILPWLLAMVGGLAGVVEFLRTKVWHRSHVRAVVVTAVVCLLAGSGLLARHYIGVPSTAEGSLPVAPDNVSQVVRDTPQPVTVPSRATFGPIWEISTPTQILSTPEIAGDIIMFGTNGREVQGHRLNDGHRLWVIRKSEPVFTNVTVAGQIGLIGEGVHTAPSASMTAFQIKTGEVLWERKFRSHLEGDVAFDGNQIWFGAGAEGLWSLKLDTGEVIWRAIIGHIDVKPLLKDGRLFTTAKLAEDDDLPGSAIFEIDPKTGRTLWQTPVPGNTMGDILAAPDDGLIFTTAIGQVGLNRETDKGWLHSAGTDGQLRWSIALPAMPLPEGTVLPDEKLVVLTLKNGSLVAVHTETGEIAWMAGAGKEFKTDLGVIPATDHHPALIVAVPDDGRVTIRRVTDGKEVMTLKLPEGGYAAPVYENDRLYLATTHTLTAYGPVSALVIAP